MAASIAAPLDLLAGWLALVSPAQACQALLALLGAGIVAATLLPAGTQKHLLDYGARDASGAAAASTGSNTAAGHSSAAGAQPASSPPHPEASALEKAVASVVARTQVPHNWFVSFYVFHLLCTAFWVEEWWRWSRDAAVSVSASASTSASPNNLFGLLVMSQQNADLRATPSPAPSMALVQVLVGMGLMALHTGRRLYEYIYVFQPSKSKMNISHLALGLVFYAILSVAVWIEGSQAIMAKEQSAEPLPALTLAAGPQTWLHMAVAVPLFLLAWAGQYRCHAHLASLKKYTLPTEGLFRHLVCPHYTCELLLYLALAIATAPDGRLVNRTVLSSEPFIVVCLGVTARRTRAWYIGKFGAASVQGKWSMIPFVF